MAVNSVYFETGDGVMETSEYYEIISDFMRTFRKNPDDLIKDLVNLYPKESLHVMDNIVKYTNTPALLK